MYDRPRITLAEELLLLSAVPETGQLKQPWYFDRVLAGAVLTDLLLAGAIAVEGRQITRVRPLPLGDPVGDHVLDALAREGKSRWSLRIERWLDKILHDVSAPYPSVDQPYLEALAARGQLRAQPRFRILGLFPYTAWYATEPGSRAEPARRIADVAGVWRPDCRPPLDDRDLHRAALAGAGGLQYRLFPGRGHRDIRHRIRELTRSTPIAEEVRKAIEDE
ncbi:GPP34 family phosphoprotein [Streptomyces sp. NPDC002896]|uniref:GOLPH3/VPS74 family protein n=1 Tax=Streptomyces sp. NPDC002896 TaxID=3154438 RepID=UPI0033292771